ncbi:hypothetical protein GCM10009564_23080 [Streptomyces thermogriseus]|uniref:Uncharacterized protein n=1 Tax=Streptomyces thermogriseus TaxID=75292 RepID=A0ABN1SYU9_9ACTN
MFHQCGTEGTDREAGGVETDCGDRSDESDGHAAGECSDQHARAVRDFHQTVPARAVLLGEEDAGSASEGGKENASHCARRGDQADDGDGVGLQEKSNGEEARQGAAKGITVKNDAQCTEPVHQRTGKEGADQLTDRADGQYCRECACPSPGLQDPQGDGDRLKGASDAGEKLPQPQDSEVPERADLRGRCCS